MAGHFTNLQEGVHQTPLSAVRMYLDTSVAPTIVSVTTAAATSAALTVNRIYLVHHFAGSDCFVKQGASTVAAAATNFGLREGESFELSVSVAGTTGDGYLGAICASTGETATLHLLPYRT